MELRGSNIKNTIGRLSSVQVSKIGKQIGASGSTFQQRRAIEQHIKENHGTVLKAEGFLKKIGLNKDRKEFESVMSGLRGGAAGNVTADKNNYASLSDAAKKDMIKKASHDEDLRDKIIKNLKKDGDFHGADRFIKRVAEEKEDFQKRMRSQSLYERLKLEAQGAYKYGDNNKIGGQASVSASNANQLPPDNQSIEKTDNTPPSGFNNFAI